MFVDKVCYLWTIGQFHGIHAHLENLTFTLNTHSLLLENQSLENDVVWPVPIVFSTYVHDIMA